MSKQWFTSDLHMCHSNIITFCQRPFANVDEMNEALINNHNSVVSPDDEVFILGDFSFDRKGDRTKAIFERLAGKKILVQGNHDHRITLDLPWVSKHHILEQKIGNDLVVMCHFPMKSWSGSHTGSLHLHGHSHGTMQGTSQSVDCGVDMWDWTPRELHELKRHMATLPKYEEKNQILTHYKDRPENKLTVSVDPGSLNQR